MPASQGTHVSLATKLVHGGTAALHVGSSVVPVMLAALSSSSGPAAASQSAGTMVQLLLRRVPLTYEPMGQVSQGGTGPHRFKLFLGG